MKKNKDTLGNWAILQESLTKSGASLPQTEENKPIFAAIYEAMELWSRQQNRELRKENEDLMKRIDLLKNFVTCR